VWSTPIRRVGSPIQRAPVLRGLGAPRGRPFDRSSSISEGRHLKRQPGTTQDRSRQKASSNCGTCGKRNPSVLSQLRRPLGPTLNSSIFSPRGRRARLSQERQGRLAAAVVEINTAEPRTVAGTRTARQGARDGVSAVKCCTTRRARTYHCRRTRQFPAPSRQWVRRWRCPSWVGCTITISEREFPTGTPPAARLSFVSPMLPREC
jgi:hypothetical protein